jgi:hypothetical protein
MRRTPYAHGFAWKGRNRPTCAVPTPTRVMLLSAPRTYGLGLEPPEPHRAEATRGLVTREEVGRC